jgi:hypothetical protein
MRDARQRCWPGQQWYWAPLPPGGVCPGQQIFLIRHTATRDGDRRVENSSADASPVVPQDVRSGSSVSRSVIICANVFRCRLT